MSHQWISCRRYQIDMMFQSQKQRSIECKALIAVQFPKNLNQVTRFSDGRESGDLIKDFRNKNSRIIKRYQIPQTSQEWWVPRSIPTLELHSPGFLSLSSVLRGTPRYSRWGVGGQLKGATLSRRLRLADLGEQGKRAEDRLQSEYVFWPSGCLISPAFDFRSPAEWLVIGAVPAKSYYKEWN